MAVNIKTVSQTYPIMSFSDTAEPLWGSDSGRNSNSGKFTGTFVGYFTNLHIKVGPMTKSEMDGFKAIFEVPIIENLTFPNSSNNGVDYTENFYGTAIEAKTEYWDGMYEPFEFDLVAVEARNDI